MRRAEHAETFRLHFSGLVLASQLRVAEEQLERSRRDGRPLRRRRAEREVERLRLLAPVRSSGAGPAPVPSAMLRSRIAAYTSGVEPLAPVAAAPAGNVRSSAWAGGRGGTKLALAALGCATLVAAAATVLLLAAKGIGPAAGAAEVGLLVSAVAWFLAWVGAADGQVATEERRSGRDRRSGADRRRTREQLELPPGRERRSGSDRRRRARRSVPA